MPEGDTVHLAADRLDRALRGRTLVSADLRVPAVATSDLSGRRIHEVIARGKHLLLRLDGDLTLHTHLKMEGSWHLYKPGSRWRGANHQIRAILTTSEWIAVGFRLGLVELVPTHEEASIVGHLGPDVLGPDWDAREALLRMSRFPDRPLEEVLLDQRVIAGPGNIYKSEICFLAGIDPRTPVAAARDLGVVIGLLKRTMEANRGTGRQITTGDTRPGRTHWVYGRAGLGCRRCGSEIRRSDDRDRVDGRVTFWCPTCQPPSVSASGGGVSIRGHI